MSETKFDHTASRLIAAIAPHKFWVQFKNPVSGFYEATVNWFIENIDDPTHYLVQVTQETFRLLLEAARTDAISALAMMVDNRGAVLGGQIPSIADSLDDLVTRIEGATQSESVEYDYQDKSDVEPS